VRIGVKPGQIGLTIAELRRCWREAEDAGFESVWTFDHLTSRAGEPIYEATALMAAMAEVTSQVRIGCLALSNGTRRLETLAATLATVDALSDGRLEVGLGMASMFAKMDFDALGIRFPRWSDRTGAYVGAVDRLIELTSPGSALGAKPVQSPVPLILGGRSRAVREAAIERNLSWNLSGGSVEDFRELKAGQSDAQAQVFLKSVPSVADAVAEFREAGATRLVLVMEPPIEPGDVARLAVEAGL
jgi:alkanesulfonate monooxygenase SsuD/methylene tetrahydromethanopterin reductase-like flavin-dependent oxidoreductase (luciferase family)